MSVAFRRYFIICHEKNTDRKGTAGNGTKPLLTSREKKYIGLILYREPEGMHKSISTLQSLFSCNSNIGLIKMEILYRKFSHTTPLGVVRRREQQIFIPLYLSNQPNQ